MNRRTILGRPSREAVRNKLEAVLAFPRRYRSVLRCAQADPRNWIVLLMQLAGSEDSDVGHMAARVLLDLVSGAQGIEEVLEVYRRLPRQTAALADVAVCVTERLLRSLPEAPQLGGFPSAVLWNNLSARCLDAEQRERAVQAAEMAVRVSVLTPDARPEAFRIRTLCFLTASKARAASGRIRSALNAVEEACSLAARLSRGGRKQDLILEGRALSLRANRLAAVGRLEEAVRSAERARTLLREAPVTVEARFELAVAELALANGLNDLGLYERAFSHAEEADGLFRWLVGKDHDRFLEFSAAAATALAECFARCGQPESALKLSCQTVNRMEELTRRQAERFGRDFVAYLVNLSDATGERGDFDKAVFIGRRAVHEARLLGHRLGQRDWYIEGIALNNLFNLLYRLQRFREADRVGKRALRSFRCLPDSHPEAHIERGRTLRNLAEAQRMLARRGGIGRAMAKARQAVAEARRGPLANSATGMLLEAQCRSTLAACLEDGEQFDEAVREARVSLRIRRGLHRKYPSAHRSDLAYSLYLLSRLLLRVGRIEAARAAAREAMGHYQALVDTGPERLAAFLSGSLRVLAEAELAVKRTRVAVSILEQAIRLVRPRYTASPEVWMVTLLPLCTRYVEVCECAGLRWKSDLVQDVIEKAVRAVPEGVGIPGADSSRGVQKGGEGGSIALPSLRGKTGRRG